MEFQRHRSIDTSYWRKSLKENKLSILRTTTDDETDIQSWQRKKETMAHPTNQTPEISFEIFATHKSDHRKPSIIQKLSSTNSLAIQQNNDIILEQIRLKIMKADYSETIRLQDNRYHHYCRQFDRLSVT